MTFSKRQTNVLKGIAVMLLFIHHALNPVARVTEGAWGIALTHLVSLGKLCVAIFAILSGYGMYVSYTSKKKPMLRFVLAHVWKLYLVFWTAALLQICVTSLIKGNFAEIYPDRPVYYLLLDLLALAYPMHSPKYSASWWYITATVAYYCLFPLFYFVVSRLRRWNYLLVLAMAAAVFVLPGMESVRVYGCVFVTGMIFAERDIFNRFLNWKEGSIWPVLGKIGGCTVLLAALIFLRQKLLADTGQFYYADWLLALVLILLVGEISCHWMPKRAGFLELSGIYSFEMYLMHGIFLRYFTGYVFSSYYSFFVIARLYLCVFPIAAVLHALMGRVRGLPGRKKG